MILARKKLRKRFLKSKNIAKLSVEFSILNKPFWDGAKRRHTLWKSKSMVVPFLIRWSLPVNFLRKKFQSRAPLQRMKWLTSLVLPREKDSKVTVHLYLSFITFETFKLMSKITLCMIFLKKWNQIPWLSDKRKFYKFLKNYFSWQINVDILLLLFFRCDITLAH